MAWISEDVARQKLLVFGLLACLIVFAVTKIEKVVRERKLLPLPPMPPGFPLVGNLPQLQKAGKTREEHLLFQRWAEEYGPLYRVKIGLFTQYMVNTDLAVKEIFDKSARQSADRPPTIVSRDHISNGLSLLTLDSSSPRWKLQRKVTWSNVGSIARANEGLPYLNFETLKFLHEVVSDPKLQTSSNALWGAVKRYTYSNFATQMFGLEIPKLSDPCIEYIHETAEAQVLGTIPGYYVVDILPFLNRLPMFLKPWERNGRERFRRDMRWITEKMHRVQAMSDKERALIKDSLMCKIVEDEKHLGFDTKEEGAYVCMQLTIAGSDTSQASLWCFLEAMMRFPDVQEKAYKLLDEAMGDRIPVFEDHERVPYIRCMVKETLRWRPPVSLGQPHCTSADITFEGMRIPKGSFLHLNAWAVQHNPDRHQDPERFWPERYLNDPTSTMESLNNPDATKRDHFAFGAGRRVCSGYNVAERSLTVAIMRILWTFEVKIAPHAKLPLDTRDWSGLFPGTPGEDMPVMLVPRKHKVPIIQKEFAAAQADRALFQSLDGK